MSMNDTDRDWLFSYLQHEDNIRKFFTKIRKKIEEDRNHVTKIISDNKDHEMNDIIELIFGRILNSEDQITSLAEVAFLNNATNRKQIHDTIQLLSESNIETSDRFHQFKDRIDKNETMLKNKTDKIDIDRIIDEYFSNLQKKVEGKHDN